MKTILRNGGHAVTWEILFDLEPRLKEARTVRDIGRLVGWSANTVQSVLRSSAAYHLALDSLLPASEEDDSDFQRQIMRKPLGLVPQMAWVGTSWLEACS